MSIVELRKDTEELNSLIGTATRQRVMYVLVKAKAEFDIEIINLEMKEKIAAERKATGTESNKKRYMCELHEYAWDQSERYVKIFVTLPGVEKIDESNVVCTYTENSMKLLVNDLNGKDYNLTVNNLLESIDVIKSYHKVKTGMVAVYMKKVKENTNWGWLTTIQKRIKDKSEDEFKKDDDASDPAGSLVNIMKKLYDSGDTQTKQMIAKAWTESQEKLYKGGNPSEL